MERSRQTIALGRFGVIALLLVPVVSGPLLADSTVARDAGFAFRSADASIKNSALEHIQFRGLLQMDDAWLFNLRDMNADVSFWVEIGQSARDVEAKSYDAEASVLTVSYQGQEHQLTLSQANSAPLPVAQSKAIAAPGSASIELPPLPQKTPPAPPALPNGGAPPDTPPPSEPPAQPEF